MIWDSDLPMLRIRFEGMLRDISECVELQLPGNESRRLGDVLRMIEARFPGVLGSSAEYQWRYGSTDVFIALNGKVLDSPDETMVLHNGDELTFIPPLGGG